MKLSVIIPAFNEEDYLAATLEAIGAALADIDESEVIVVDNDSTDGTRAVAEGFDVRIVTEHEHNISQVRNTGGANATGDVLVFIDADTIVRSGLFEKIINAMGDERCFGGSVAVEYTEANRKWIRYYLMGWVFWGRVLKMRHGAAQFCRKGVFHELGGYDSTIFMGEDIEFQWRLAKKAKANGGREPPRQPKRLPPLLRKEGSHSSGYTTFIEEPRVLTSSRRYSKMGLVKTLFLTHPITILLTWRVRSMWKDWYENAVR